MSQAGKQYDGTHLPDIETLTGNIGGAVGPDGAFNIDITGPTNSGIYVTGIPASNELNIAMYSPFFGVFEFSQAGAVTVITDILTLTNRGNNAAMTGTGTAILFNQWYWDAVTPAVADAGRIAMVTEGNWTNIAASQDASLSFQTVLNGALTEFARLSTTVFHIYQNHDLYLHHTTTAVEEKNQISWRIEDGSECARISAYRRAIADAPTDLIFTIRSTASTAERVRFTSVGGTVYAPFGVANIVAGTGVTVDMLARIIRVQGSGGAVTITATPNIADGLDGQEVIFIGQSDANTLTFQDEAILANSGLQLAGGANFTMGLYDTLHLVFDATLDKWCEVSRSNN